MESDDQVVATLLDLERRRCAAWGGVDTERTLQAILSDDLWYVHGNGKRDAKSSLIELLLSRQFPCERITAEVEIDGDHAVTSGQLAWLSTAEDGSPPERAREVYILQHWRRGETGWQLAHHLTVPKVLSGQDDWFRSPR